MPEQKDININGMLTSLTSWFKDKLSCTDLKLESLGSPENTGFSNETISLKAIYSKGNKLCERSFVLRLKPTEFQVFPEYDLGKQVKVMSALRKSGLPIPKVIWEEDNVEIISTPFYVMQLIDGQAPSDSPPFHMDLNGWVSAASPFHRKELWWGWVDSMSKVHLLDPEELNLLFLDQPLLGETPLDQCLSYYENFLNWSLDGEQHEVCENVLAWLKENKPTDLLQKRLCWGDCRCGNILYKNYKPTALLDWEMASLGDPEMDLAWGIAIDDANSLGLKIPRLKGFPERQQTIERWERNTGFKAKNYAYYRILALFKFAVIMINTSKKMISIGFLEKDSNYYLDNHVTQYLSLEMEAI